MLLNAHAIMGADVAISDTYDDIYSDIMIEDPDMTGADLLLYPDTPSQPFNVEIDLPTNYRNVNPGNEIWFTVKLLNLANAQRVDIVLNYELLDLNNNLIMHNSKTVAIETQASFVADLVLPIDISSGDYYLRVVVNSTMGESTARSMITVSIPEADFTVYYVVGGLVFVVLLAFIFVKSKPAIARARLRAKISDIVRKKLSKK
jgi:hypothetical protein